MRARRLRSRRIWPKATWRWRTLREMETSTLGRRVSNTSAPWHSPRAMPKYCEESGGFAARMGRFDAGLEATGRAVVLDPLARASHASLLGRTLYAARRFEEAVMAFSDVISLDPGFKSAYGERGLSFYGLGDLQRARASCEMKPDHWTSQQCLAVIYDKLGRHADAETELAKLKALGDGGAYQYATIYAQ